MNHFAQWLVAELERKDMSQTELAEKVGCSKQAISDWIAGRAGPSPRSISQIARVLGTDSVEVYRALGRVKPRSSKLEAEAQEAADLVGLLPAPYRQIALGVLKQFYEEVVLAQGTGEGVGGKDT